VALSLLLFGGPLLYLLSQTVYLWAVVGTRSLPRLAGIAAIDLPGLRCEHIQRELRDRSGRQQPAFSAPACPPSTRLLPEALSGLARKFVGGKGGSGLVVTLWLAGRLGLGRLPSDIVVRRGSFTFAFPLATSLLLSLIATILLNLWLRGRR
jgi:hypothetical protein